MQANAYIGIDLGTSGCRAIAIDDNGDIIAQSQLPLDTPQQSLPISQQDPQYHWRIVLAVLTQLVKYCRKYRIISIAVDATSGSVLLTDIQGQPLTPMLMYNDAQSIKASDIIAKLAPEQCAAHGANSGLAKLMWLQQHIHVTDYKLLHQVDWINFNLGAPLAITDENNALKTGYDPIKRHWPQWLDQITNRHHLPTVVPPGTEIGQLSSELCTQLNLDTRPKIIAGTTDSIAALIAAGAREVGDAVTSLGSTLVLKLISDMPIFIPKQGIYSHRLGENWLVGGASNTGGAVLKHFFNDRQLSQLSEQISFEVTPPDYYPLLSVGERFPIYDPLLQPRMTPRPEDDALFLYGLLDGIARIEQQGYQYLQHAGATAITNIRTTGGGAINTVWQTIRQKYMAVPFISPKRTEAAYGAACLAKGL